MDGGGTKVMALLFLLHRPGFFCVAVVRSDRQGKPDDRQKTQRQRQRDRERQSLRGGGGGGGVVLRMLSGFEPPTSSSFTMNDIIVIVIVIVIVITYYYSCVCQRGCIYLRVCCDEGLSLSCETHTGNIRSETVDRSWARL